MQIPAIVNEKLPNFVRQTYNVSCQLNVSFGFVNLISNYEHLHHFSYMTVFQVKLEFVSKYLNYLSLTTYYVKVF